MDPADFITAEGRGTSKGAQQRVEACTTCALPLANRAGCSLGMCVATMHVRPAVLAGFFVVALVSAKWGCARCRAKRAGLEQHCPWQGRRTHYATSARDERTSPAHAGQSVCRPGQDARASDGRCHCDLRRCSRRRAWPGDTSMHCVSVRRRSCVRERGTPLPAAMPTPPRPPPQPPARAARATASSTPCASRRRPSTPQCLRPCAG